jgi:hypothetical protein
MYKYPNLSRHKGHVIFFLILPLILMLLRYIERIVQKTGCAIIAEKINLYEIKKVA